MKRLAFKLMNPGNFLFGIHKNANYWLSRGGLVLMSVWLCESHDVCDTYSDRFAGVCCNEASGTTCQLQNACDSVLTERPSFKVVRWSRKPLKFSSWTECSTCLISFTKSFLTVNTANFAQVEEFPSFQSFVWISNSVNFKSRVHLLKSFEIHTPTGHHGDFPSSADCIQWNSKLCLASIWFSSVMNANQMNTHLH